MKEDLQGVGVVVEFTRLIDISRASSATTRRCGGFTLLELIMVIIIAGIMAAIAVPKFSKVSAIDVSAVARQVQSDIRYTQELAMSKYRRTTITFTEGGSTYTISSSSSETKSLPARSKAKFDSSSSTAFVFTFNSLGEPITGGDGTLRISAGGVYKDITVEARTGRATIQ
ncbi:MAG TPA: pilus assembly FimT family protein [Candidatus Hypogeohydataceae bacterium YC38]